MKEKLPLAFSVGLVCLVAVWVTSLPAVAVFCPTYVVFLMWATQSVAGGGIQGVKSALICNITGAFWGFIGVVAFAPLFSFAGSFALPIAIFFVAAILVIQSCWTPLAFIPASFVGCATYFAVANSANVGPKGYVSILIATIIGAVAGNLCGLASDTLTNALSKKNS